VTQRSYCLVLRDYRGDDSKVLYPFATEEDAYTAFLSVPSHFDSFGVFPLEVRNV